LDALPDSSGKVYWDGKEIGGAFPGGVDGDGIIPAFNAGTWYHVVITGNAPESFTDEVLLIGTGNPTHSGTYWDGEIDDVRIYSRDLNSDEILALYNSGSGTESETGSLDTNLVAHYLMNDDLATTNVMDGLGDYNGTSIRNTNLMTTSKIGKALDFNGSSDRIIIPTNQILSNGATNFSMLAWVNSSEDSRRQQIFTFGNGSTGQGIWIFKQNDNLLSVDLSNIGGTQGGSLESGTGWHQVGLVSTDGIFQLYLDGSPSGFTFDALSAGLDLQFASLGSTSSTGFQILGSQPTDDGSVWWFNGKWMMFVFILVY